MASGDPEFRRRRGLASGERAAEGRQFGRERARGSGVARDVVQGDPKDVLVVGEPQQRGA
jgi:hypothetical protein